MMNIVYCRLNLLKNRLPEKSSREAAAFVSSAGLRVGKANEAPQRFGTGSRADASRKDPRGYYCRLRRNILMLCLIWQAAEKQEGDPNQILQKFNLKPFRPTERSGDKVPAIIHSSFKLPKEKETSRWQRENYPFLFY
jgi:hypothetical protein